MKRWLCGVAAVVLACHGDDGTAVDSGTDVTTKDVGSSDAITDVLDASFDAEAGPLPVLVVGEDTSCLLSTTSFKCWGANYVGQLTATPDMLPHATPVTLASTPAFAAASYHLCAQVGTETRCWGANRFNELGHDNHIELESGSDAEVCNGIPCNASPMPVALTGAGLLVAGDYGSCAVAGGVLSCWGSNSSGELGVYPLDGASVCNGNVECSATPVVVPGLANVRDVAVGGTTCASLKDGSVWCWGGNYLGELGQGTFDSTRHAPTQVPSLGPVSRVVTGGGHFCALSGGTVACWGWNDYGQLGHDPNNDIPCGGGQTCSDVPVGVPGVTTARDLCAGYGWTCAVTNADTVLCWGGNGSGQLGHDPSADDAGISASPTVVAGLSNVAQIGCGASHACALERDGTVWCWGDDWIGQAGEPDAGGFSFAPKKVQGL